MGLISSSGGMACHSPASKVHTHVRRAQKKSISTSYTTEVYCRRLVMTVGCRTASQSVHLNADDDAQRPDRFLIAAGPMLLGAVVEFSGAVFGCEEALS